MDVEVFKKSPAGRLRDVTVGDADAKAFVPNPLPPDLTLNEDLLNAVADAGLALGELAGLGRNLPNANLLIRPFSRREAVLSSRIEGTQTDLTQLYEFEADQDRSDATHDAREVLNYVRAMEYGLERNHELPMASRLLSEIHGVLLRGTRGQDKRPGNFREIQVWLGQSSDIGQARFVPPPHQDVPDLLRDLDEYVNTNTALPALIRLALIHYQFETIHPFMDGNGRVGRLMIILLLVHWELLPSPLLYLSAWFERHRQRYYDLLLNVSATGAWSDWVLFFLEGVKVEANNAKDTASELLQTQAEWRETVVAANGTTKMLALVEHLLETPILSAAQIRDQLDCTHQTAMTTLRRLAELGIVDEKEGPNSNARSFVASKLLSIVARE